MLSACCTPLYLTGQPLSPRHLCTNCSSAKHCRTAGVLIASHLAEELHGALEDDEQNTTYGAQLVMRVAHQGLLRRAKTNSPPGPSLNTLGRKPLYRAAKPSSLMTVATAGQAQLYLGTDPATLGEFWILDLTTSLSMIKSAARAWSRARLIRQHTVAC